MKVEVSEQVLGFVRCQAPEPRRRLKLALRHLADERGDIQPLEGSLRGYRRLRVGPYRIIFAVTAASGAATVAHCLFAERRDVVYAVFSQNIKARLLRE
jgi:mRNA-degrading endonuclease RelE of RelBE toxin-antitoxin system